MNLYLILLRSIFHIFRAKAQMMQYGDAVISSEQTQLKCIGVDSKIDKGTLTYEESTDHAGNLMLKKCKMSEHHLVFTSESGEAAGKYLTHKVIPHPGCTGAIMADNAIDVLTEYQSLVCFGHLGRQYSH